LADNRGGVTSSEILSKNAPYDWTFNFLIRTDGSQSMQGMWVTDSYLPVMGLKAVVGRGFEPSDFGTRAGEGGSPGVRVLAARVQWRSTNYRQNCAHQPWDVPPTVVGVMQPGVRFLPSPGAAKEPNYDVNGTVDFWIPAAPDPKYLKDPYRNLVARLRDRTTQRQGEEELALLAARGTVGEGF
jgi:putative ABC transport system permease protein